MVAPWDIYAKQLFDQGYGHPLWAPEPSHHFGEVRIGDVGYISEGRFIFLFRSTLPPGDPVNVRGTPQGHVPFEIPTASIHVRPNEIAQDLLTSQSIQSMSVSGQAGISLPSSSGNVAEACLRYKCTQQAGALLLLKDSGHATRLTCHDKIREYMHAHLSRWYTFATEELGIDVGESEIIFVSGYVKTTVWGEITFHSRTTDGELILSGGFVGPPTVGGSGSLAVSLSRCEKPVVFYRTGPLDPSGAENVEAWSPSAPMPAPGSYSQCLFLNYHVMKTRLFRSKVMRAAAGPHQLPPSEDPDPDMSISQCVTRDKSISKFFDNVLDYMLEQYPGIEVSCLSDEDTTRIRAIICNWYESHDNQVSAERDLWDIDIAEVFQHIPQLADALSAHNRRGVFEWEEPAKPRYRRSLDPPMTEYYTPLDSLHRFLYGDVSHPPRLERHITDGAERSLRRQPEAQANSFSLSPPSLGYRALADPWWLDSLPKPDEAAKTSPRQGVLDIAIRHLHPRGGEVIPQLDYTDATDSGGQPSVEEVELQPPVLFWSQATDKPGGPVALGIPLGDLNNSDSMRLQGRDDVVFENQSPSLSLLINWPGYSTWCRHILLSSPEPLTRAQLVAIIATSVEHFVEVMGNHKIEDKSMAHWRVGPLYIKADDLILLGLENVSKGTWQPQFRLLKK